MVEEGTYKTLAADQESEFNKLMKWQIANPASYVPNEDSSQKNGAEPMVETEAKEELDSSQQTTQKGTPFL